MRLFLYLGLGMLVGGAALRADFSFEQTAEVTGGMMKSAMRMAGMFSRKARAPMRTRTAVKGSRMARIETDRIQITDLDAGTITTIYPKKKRYQVVTFDQVRRYLEKMAARRRPGEKARQPELKVQVSVRPTGRRKTIDGRPAREFDVKVRMEGQDRRRRQGGAMEVDMHSWMARPAAGYQEVQAFYRRLAAKLGWMPGAALGNVPRGNPGSVEGLQSVYKAAAKLDGMPVLQVVSMGSAGGGAGRASAGGGQPPHSLEGSIVRGLGGFGRFGRHHRKQTGASPAPARSGGVLMEMTIHYRNFSNAPVDASLLDTTPAGYKRVKSNMEKALP